jgi:Immunity protein 35
MALTGYEGCPLYNGTELLAQPGFWAVHLSLWGDVKEAELAAEFGVAVDDVAVMGRRLSDVERWPVFRIDLPRRVVFRVIYRNSDPDFGTDFVLSHPGWPKSVMVAALEGHFTWPGLSWRELCWIADHPPPGSRWVTEWERRILLFLPCMGDADLPDTAVGTVAEALERVGAAESARLAERLLTGAREPVWSYDRTGALTCTFRHAGRSVAPGGTLTPTQARAVTRVLTDTPVPDSATDQVVRQFLATTLSGDAPLEEQITSYAYGAEGPDVVCGMADQIRRLLADPEFSDDDQAHTREMLAQIADQLEQAVRRPLRPHPLTRRAPNLSRLLEEFTRDDDGRDGLDEVVRAGAEWLGVRAVRTVVREADALLDNTAISDDELSDYVLFHQRWLLDDSGRHSIRQIAAMLRGWALERPGRNIGLKDARIIAEQVLDRTVRRNVDDVVIDDRWTREAPDAWVFVYNTRDYLRTGAFEDMLAGNVYLVIDRVTGRSHFDV